MLPISNPANLVIYGSRIPPLLEWLPRYTLPSLLAIGATSVALRFTQRAALRASVATDIAVPGLSAGGRCAVGGIIAAAGVLLAASGFDLQLGLPTFLAGLASAALVLSRSSTSLGAVVRGISWGVLPLVAGLFVLAEALSRTGVTAALAAMLNALVRQSAPLSAWVAGVTVAVGSNLVNNLPAGLLAGSVVNLAQVPEAVRAAVLIGVDLGPNLSVTSSLATILWLTALRREGQYVGAWAFPKLGMVVMPPALLLALAAVLTFG